MKRDLRVQWQMFLGIAVFIAIIATVYWFVSYEEAGTTMLALSSGLAALCGGWLFVQDHRRPGPAHDTTPVDADEHYLPTTSWWPLVMGVGMVLSLNGLILSWPYAVPGAAVLMLGIGGLVSDSRRRA